MGAICSRLLSQHAEEPSTGAEQETDAGDMSKMPKGSRTTPPTPAQIRAAVRSLDIASSSSIIQSLDFNIDHVNPSRRGSGSVSGSGSIHALPTAFDSEESYLKMRDNLAAREKTLDFDHRCRAQASQDERLVDAIIQRLKALDNERVYAAAPAKTGFGGQKHVRFPGDHFLSNLDLIHQTSLFNVAQHMPKGAHLHIHFNACLAPHILLNIAKDMGRMFITSDIPLLITDGDSSSFDRCEIQFKLLSADKENPGNLFSPAYQKDQTMKFAEFLQEFPVRYPNSSADDWLLQKLMFRDEEAHNYLQTASGAWEKFNGRTRMMKGLFNYETAYRKYTRLILEDFLRDKIQYAEIRPNFMKTNQLFRDDGTGPIDNYGIMQIITEEVEAFRADMANKNQYFGGIKVIYCTPRSFDRDAVRQALDECIDFKKRWPQWIAGFDLVGEEAKGHPLKFFISEFLNFQRQCRADHLDIPFLFHCGETLDMGTDTDGNLIDALLLNAKRIGHGFALAKHPYIMQHMKQRGICLELCPISNEILGLTPRVGGHSMYQLLANNVHCTVSSDNGTLFRSTLSHDFYQAMVGKADMGLFGWKQLAMWSLEHACLDEEEYNRLLVEWKKQWDSFLKWTIETYGQADPLP